MAILSFTKNTSTLSRSAFSAPSSITAATRPQNSDVLIGTRENSALNWLNPKTLESEWRRRMRRTCAFCSEERSARSHHACRHKSQPPNKNSLPKTTVVHFHRNREIPRRSHLSDNLNGHDLEFVFHARKEGMCCVIQTKLREMPALLVISHTEFTSCA